MIQDQQLLNHFHDLSPERQAIVVDFIEFLKQKQNSLDTPSKELRPFGVLKGKVWMSDDFDNPS